LENGLALAGRRGSSRTMTGFVVIRLNERA
jgi:hypothetical protein